MYSFEKYIFYSKATWHYILKKKWQKIFLQKLLRICLNDKNDKETACNIELNKMLK